MLVLKLKPLFRWLSLNLLVVIAYLLLAKFGMAWSNFTSNITLVWPAAGLALFCFLHFGQRIAAAIFLGSFISTLMLHFDPLFDLDFRITSLAALMAICDTLQAALIARLNRSNKQTHFNQSILRLPAFVFSIFLGCLISSSLGVQVLHHLQIVGEDELFKSWGFWWMGDAAGMLLVTPLLLWIFNKFLRQENPKARAFLLLSSMVGLSIFVLVAIGYMEADQTKQQQELAAHRFQSALENRLELSLRDMDVMNRFYDKMHPTEKDFDDLAKPLLERSPWILRLTWLPERFLGDYEKNIQDPSTYWSYALNIADRDAVHPAISEYTTLIKANSESQQLFVGNFNFTEDNKVDVFNLFHPVMDCVKVKQQACVFRGWIVADIDIGQWLNYALKQIVTDTADVALHLSYRNQSFSLFNHNQQWLKKETPPSGKLLLQTGWNLLDKTWNLTIFQETRTGIGFSWIQLSAFGGCLLVIVLLIAYVNAQQKTDDMLVNNQRQLQRDVLLHTESLRAANDWLLKEISERKLTQELLEKSQQELFQREQHLRSLLDNIPDPVWLKNVEGYYLSCNAAFANFLGLSEKDLVGKHENELVSAETAKEFKNNDEKALRNNFQPHRYEQWLLSQDGSQHLLDTLKVGIKNQQGDVIGVLGIARDVTEKHQLITALQIARDAAEKATQSKSLFLANMSHEIRTPLNAVLGYTQLLIRDKDIDSKQKEKLSAILTSSHKLLGLINDILDLSKIESGALVLKQDYFDLHQEMATVITIVNDRARAKGLPLLTQFAIPKPFVVKGDRQKLGQILINLLGNAIKFTHQGEIKIELFASLTGVEFVVTDSGTGIPEKELSELFVAFKQGIAGEHAGGTGLGLTLSRHLAEAMGGSLQLQSQIGVGTKAFLHLPFTQESIRLSENDLEKIKSVSLSKNVNVLVVEDDLDSNQVLVDLLAQVGCRVTAAMNGREGIDKSATENFDLIFTDIRMPDVNGLQMLQTLRAQPRYQQIPMIAVSASSLEHEREYYLAQGFQDFIGKPYAFDEIFQALVKFAGAQYDESVSENTVDDSLPLSNEKMDLQKIHTELEILLAYAAQGDMSNTKSTLAKLDPDALGKENHQHLMNALKNYRLEKVEALVRGWLELLEK
jgi:two-component system, OmpR family, aerobic respiration control sensor histidine kinase ArcB